MTWRTYVSQRSWKRFQRGGEWIDPKIYQACQAKARAQAWQPSRGGGAGWTASGRRPQPASQPGRNGWAAPRRQPASEPYRWVMENPKPPGGTPTGQEKLAPKPSSMSPEAVQAIIAQVLAIQPQGMTQQQAIQISEVITSAIPAVSATPQELLEDDRKWSLRVSHAHEKLRYWKAQHDDRREAQRKMNRQLDDAAAHIEYWQATLDSAKRKDPNWESRQPYVGIDFDHDSLADDQEEDDQDLMEAEAPSTLASPCTKANATELVRTPAEIVLSNAFQPLAGAPFPQPPSPFTAVGTDAAPLTDPKQDPLLIAEEHRKHTIRTEGSLQGYPEDIINMAAEGGHTWQSTQSAFEIAHHFYEAYRIRGETRDLTCNPLIKRMVEVMVANNKPVQAQADAQPHDAHPPPRDTEVGADMH